MSPYRTEPDGPVEVRHVQPYQAVKTYRCPGCDHEIPPGLGHEVVVPRRRARASGATGTPGAGSASRAPRALDGRLERAFDHLDHRRGAALDQHRRDVEAQRRAAPALGTAPSQRMASVRIARCFVARDRFGRRAERGAACGSSPRRTRRTRAAAERPGRARPRGSASCGRAIVVARRLVPARDQVLAPRPSARRGSGAAVARHRLTGPCPASSSMLTSLNVTTRTLATKRAGRYMSQTHASCSSSSK